MRQNETAKQYTEAERLLRQRFNSHNVAIKPLMRTAKNPPTAIIDMMIEPEELDLVQQAFKGFPKMNDFPGVKKELRYIIMGPEALRVARTVLDDLIYGKWRGFVDDWERLYADHHA